MSEILKLEGFITWNISFGGWILTKKRYDREQKSGVIFPSETFDLCEFQNQKVYLILKGNPPKRAKSRLLSEGGAQK